ncbi:MAG TPA: hypothetical protein VH479_24840 [Acidimicrobiales bacterium]
MTDVAPSRQDADAIIGGGKAPGEDAVSIVLAVLRASRESAPPPMSAELLDQLGAEPPEA